MLHRISYDPLWSLLQVRDDGMKGSMGGKKVNVCLLAETTKCHTKEEWKINCKRKREKGGKKEV